MPSTTKSEAVNWSKNHARTAAQCRERMKHYQPGSTAYAMLETEALDHEQRAKGWKEYANKMIVR